MITMSLTYKSYRKPIRKKKTGHVELYVNPLKSYAVVTKL